MSLTLLAWSALVLVVGLASVSPADAHDAEDGSAVADSLTHYYATQDAAAIARLYQQATTREERLLCRYRLFPMTLDGDYIADIPAADGVRSARELALIAALWGYRAARGPAWNLPTYGRRSESTLRRARAADPEEPYVLLVEGQALLYKPALFGGNPTEALAKFRTLREVLRHRPAVGLHPFEAEIWIWMSLRKLRSPEAESTRRRLLDRHPPALFRQFLVDPP